MTNPRSQLRTYVMAVSSLLHFFQFMTNPFSGLHDPVETLRERLNFGLVAMHFAKHKGENHYALVKYLNAFVFGKMMQPFTR